MIEQLLIVSNKRAAKDTGPGPVDLIAGDKTNGLYGTLSSDFFTGSSLASACGIGTIGTLINDSTRWIKAALDGKVVYWPMLPIRWGISWGEYNQRSLINQNKVVTLGKYRYIVRMFTASGGGYSNLNVPNNLTPTGGSDFNRLIYPVCSETPPGVTVTKMANYTLAELGMFGNPLPQGVCFICQENSTNTYLQRNGGTGTSGDAPWYSLQNGVNKDLKDQYRGWRPILELVQ